MFDLGWTELAVVAVVALLVVGPKDLPKVLRTMGQWTRRLRSLARDFQGHVDEMIRDSELDELRDGVNTMRGKNLGKAINKMVDPDGRVSEELNALDRSARAAMSPPKGNGGRGTILPPETVAGSNAQTGAGTAGPETPAEPEPSAPADTKPTNPHPTTRAEG